MNDVLGQIWKEGVLASSRYNVDICLGDGGKRRTSGFWMRFEQSTSQIVVESVVAALNLPGGNGYRLVVKLWDLFV
jgi:hypothetical protein